MIMIFWRRLIIPGLMLFSLTGCIAEKSPNELYKQVKQSVVLITYQDKPGNGTGFFIEGKREDFTLLTVSHVIQPSKQLNLTLIAANTKEITEITFSDITDNWLSLLFFVVFFVIGVISLISLWRFLIYGLWKNKKDSIFFRAILILPLTFLVYLYSSSLITAYISDIWFNKGYSNPR